MSAEASEVIAEIKLDIGCGKNKKPGFIGVDSIAFDGVDKVMDVRQAWDYADNSVTEIHTSHFVEHLTAQERGHFVNEAYRVLIPGGKMTIITPHWASNRAYGDPTHQWPPVSEMWFYYLSKEWRAANAPHTDIEFNKDGFNCDFNATWGYSFGPGLATRNPEYQQYALQNFKEAAQDTHATLIKR